MTREICRRNCRFSGASGSMHFGHVLDNSIGHLPPAVFHVALRRPFKLRLDDSTIWRETSLWRWRVPNGDPEAAQPINVGTRRNGGGTRLERRSLHLVFCYSFARKRFSTANRRELHGQRVHGACQRIFAGPRRSDFSPGKDEHLQTGKARQSHEGKQLRTWPLLYP